MMNDLLERIWICPGVTEVLSRYSAGVTEEKDENLHSKIAGVLLEI
jgi:hypothetical protein